MMRSSSVSAVKAEIFPALGLTETSAGVFNGKWFGNGPLLEKHSPIDGTLLGRIAQGSAEDYEAAATAAQRAFTQWRTTPAPKRGELVRRLGQRLRELKT